MITAALVVAAAGIADPRLVLTELQLAGRPEETLAAVELRLADEPEAAAAMGLHYLHGHLLEGRGRIEEANDAFARSLDAAGSLVAYSRYRLASNWLARGHPEVAAGLFARVLSQGAPPALAEPTTALFIQTLARGGDCRLLTQVDKWPVTESRKRRLELARADCELRQGRSESAISRLLAILRAGQEDEPAREAAERLSQLREVVPDSRETAILIGRAFHRNRLFELSISYLQQGLGDSLPGTSPGIPQNQSDNFYALARSYFWRQDYLMAAVQFGRLAAATDKAVEKARALYQQARCYELSGNWNVAVQAFRMAYLAEPGGSWADASLLAALRLDWRRGHEGPALELYEVLAQRRDWRRLFARAAVFLAVSDLVRQRADRAPTWLDQAQQADADAAAEIEYWRGRLAELEGRLEDAVDHYLAALGEERFHPFAQAARVRLERPELAPHAAEVGRELARRTDLSSWYHAWLLLGEEDPEGIAARDRLRRGLARTRAARAFLEIDPLPAAQWPLWEADLVEAEEQLLALGVWSEGSAAVPRHFPVSNAALGFTGSQLLSRGESHRESLRLAEILGRRAEQEVPIDLLPLGFRRLLYPLPWAEKLAGHAVRHNIEPFLLAALIREESRFDRYAVSEAAARGLTQFILPTARRLGPAIGRPTVSAADLHDPEISIALGAVYLAELASRYGNSAPQVIAAYNAGERQAELWRSYCYGREPEEYLSKVGFPETRHYLERVLISRAEYRELYADQLTGG